MTSYLRALIFALLASFGTSHASDQAELMSSVIELEKTERIIELEVEFDSCPGKFKLKAQDGVMGVLATEGVEPIRFVVKIDDDASIKWHPISSRQIQGPHGKTQMLHAKRPVSVNEATSIEDLRRAGIKSVRYLTHYAKLPGQDVSNSSTSKTEDKLDPQTKPTACCGFKACDGKYWTYCSAGAGCMGDDCGFCCISGSYYPH